MSGKMFLSVDYVVGFSDCSEIDWKELYTDWLFINVPNYSRMSFAQKYVKLIIIN